eukprot:gene14425-biopygen162
MRLFNGREKNANATRIVRMLQETKGSKTYITNPDTSEERHFAFDYSFQTHSADEQGIGEYANQDTVFNLLRPCKRNNASPPHEALEAGCCMWYWLVAPFP